MQVAALIVYNVYVVKEENMTISVGDFVRSFDFKHNRDLEGDQACYMEGRVIDFEDHNGCSRYVIEVSRCVFRGKEEEAWPGRIYPPVNGTPRFFGGVCDGVELI